MDCASLWITPVDLGLLGGGRVDVPPEPLRKSGSARGGVSDRAQKLPADGAADDCVGVPRPSGPHSLKPSLEQLSAKAAQHRRVEARLFESETESMLPSEVETHLLLGLG